MNTRPIRVPVIENPQRRARRLARAEIRAGQREFLKSFDRQVAEIEARLAEEERVPPPAIHQVRADEL